PFIDNIKVTQEQLRAQFPETWAYLLSKKELLETRKSVKNNTVAWWEPERPRLPEHLMRPKIVSPHLVLVPRFTLDREGEYAISHSPLLYPKERERGIEDDLLRFFLAVLNSSICFWYIKTHSHKYQSGYVMLESKTLYKTPVPNPTAIPSGVMRNL